MEGRRERGGSRIRNLNVRGRGTALDARFCMGFWVCLISRFMDNVE